MVKAKTRPCVRLAGDWCLVIQRDLLRGRHAVSFDLILRHFARGLGGPVVLSGICFRVDVHLCSLGSAIDSINFFFYPGPNVS